MHNIFVTGCTGFLGSNLIKTLLKDSLGNYNIVGMSRLVYDSKKEYIHKNILDKITVVYGDITDYKFVDHTVNYYEIDTIFNLAAMAIVRISENSPLRTFEANVMGTLNVLEAARQNKTVKSIVGISSDKAYGHIPLEELPYKEDMALKPIGVYETSKTMADYAYQCYGKNYGLPCVVTRCCNLFGPGDTNISRIVPGSILRALKGESPVIWKGVNEFIREFVYTEDAVNSLIALAPHAEEYKGHAFNVGTGYVSRVDDFINLICDIMGTDVRAKIVKKDIEFNEIKEQYLDLNKIKSVIGELPNRTKNIRSCLEQTVNWYRENKEVLS